MIVRAWYGPELFGRELREREQMRSGLGQIVFIKKHETLKSALQPECAWLDSLQIREIRVARSSGLEGERVA